jgi:DNA-directed RNA polymerase subunit RPC12/RpoP
MMASGEIKTMSFMCAWCEAKIREFGGKPGIAHGICPDCRAKYFPETLRTIRENGKAILTECLRAIGQVEGESR